MPLSGVHPRRTKNLLASEAAKCPPNPGASRTPAAELRIRYAPGLTSRPNHASLLVGNENTILFDREDSQRDAPAAAARRSVGRGCPAGTRSACCRGRPAGRQQRAQPPSLTTRRWPRRFSGSTSTSCTHPRCRPHPRTGHPAGRASSRLRLRVDSPRRHWPRTRESPTTRSPRSDSRRGRRHFDEFERAVLTGGRRTRREIAAVRPDLGGTRRAPQRPAAHGLRLHGRLLHRCWPWPSTLLAYSSSTTSTDREVEPCPTSRNQPPAAGQKTIPNWAPRRSITPTRSIRHSSRPSATRSSRRPGSTSAGSTGCRAPAATSPRSCRRPARACR